MRVLVADDDRSIGLALQMAVEDLGHECLVAEDGTMALQIFQEHHVDAIISDWRMPGLEGPDLCRLVRQHGETPYVYFVILTVLSDPRHVLAGMQAGADDYLTKPFTVDSLHARLIAAERVTQLHHRLARQQTEYLTLATERERLLDELGRERSQLQAVLQQLPAGVVIAAAPSGDVLMTNDQVERIWRQAFPDAPILTEQRRGYRPDGSPYAPTEWPLARSILTGEVVSGEEIEVIRGDGTPATLRHSSAPIRDGDRIVAGVVVFDDVTEQRRRQREATQHEKLRALGQLASGVAHDLNQSLALVTGYAEIARTGLTPPSTLPPAELAEILRIITQAAYDGGETVKRLLTFSRAPADSPPDTTVERVDLSMLLDDVAKLTAPRWRDAAQAEGRPITLQIEADAGLTVEGSPASLREALINLIFNAVDALPTGGSITLRARAHGEWIELDVTDSGLGMPRDVQERIFEPYFTTKGEHGTGLGLAMVFGIVEQHHGQIRVESAPGQGTTIRLELPAVRAATTEAAPHDASSRTARRILVVDDMVPIRLMLARLLTQQGHRVVTAETGEEALVRLAAEPIDVLLSDVGLGAGMNGWQLATEVRKRWPAIHIVLATGWAASIDPEAARAQGIAAILAKPYRSAELAQVIESL